MAVPTSPDELTLKMLSSLILNRNLVNSGNESQMLCQSLHLRTHRRIRQKVLGYIKVTY